MSKVQAAALHALFSPSASPRWIPCPGSMTFPENRSGGSSSTYADAGTARHTVAAGCLQHKHNATHYLNVEIPINGVNYVVDEDFATDVQYYIDDVRNRAVGGHLLVEQKIDLQEWLGPGQFGTSDATIALPIAYNVTIEDLKSGRGEKVYAWAPATEASRFTVSIMLPGELTPQLVEPNFQLMLYGLGSIPLVELLMDETRTVTLVICQPPLDHIHELTISMDDMRRFGEFVKGAVADARQAMLLTPNSADHMFYLNPGEKQCRWCNAKAYCSKLAAYVEEEVRMDFEDVAGDGAPKRPEVPVDTARLAHAYAALPLIQMWSSAVSASVHELVSNGTPVLGSDKKPMKFVEGKLGNRAWTNEKDAESALCGVLPVDKAYAPKKIVSPSVAAKMLDKKATKETWKDVFEPLIRRPPGRPMLVLGSDPRPPFEKKAGAEDFEEVSDNGEE